MKVAVNIDLKTKAARKLFEFLKSLPFVEVSKEPYNKETLKAMEDAKKGKVETLSLEELRKEMYS